MDKYITAFNIDGTQIIIIIKNWMLSLNMYWLLLASKIKTWSPLNINLWHSGNHSQASLSIKCDNSFLDGTNRTSRIEIQLQPSRVQVRIHLQQWICLLYHNNFNTLFRYRIICNKIFLKVYYCTYITKIHQKTQKAL